MTRDQTTYDSADAAGKAEPFRETRILADVLSGPLGSLVLQDLGVRPRQTRALDSVGRILSAASEMMQGHASAAISLESISVAAGVTPQAAYRYFKDADGIMRVLFRCLAARAYRGFVDRLSEGAFADEAELTRSIVGAVLETREGIWNVPSPMRDNVLGEYRQLGLEASMLLADLVCSDLSIGDARRSVRVEWLAACFTATIAISASPVSKAHPSRDDETMRDMLTRTCGALLQGGGDRPGGFSEDDRSFRLCPAMSFAGHWSDRAPLSHHPS